jgi:hypothetical protein
MNPFEKLQMCHPIRVDQLLGGTIGCSQFEIPHGHCVLVHSAGCPITKLTRRGRVTTTSLQRALLLPRKTCCHFSAQALAGRSAAAVQRI